MERIGHYTQLPDGWCYATIKEVFIINPKTQADNHLDMGFDPLIDILFRPCIRTPKQGAATAVSLLLDERWKEVTGLMFASCKPKKVKDKFMNHPQARQLWADTKAYLEKLKLEEPIG